jgi:hypothetical protein
MLAQAAGEVAQRFRSNGYNAHDLSSVLWAYATAGLHHEPLFEAAASVCERHAHALSACPQALANVMWALGAAGHRHEPLLRIAAARLATLQGGVQQQERRQEGGEPAQQQQQQQQGRQGRRQGRHAGTAGVVAEVGPVQPQGPQLNAQQAAAVLMSLATLQLSARGSSRDSASSGSTSSPERTFAEARATELAACAGVSRLLLAQLRAQPAAAATAIAAADASDASKASQVPAVPLRALARCCWAMAVLGYEDATLYREAFAAAEAAAQQGPLGLRECTLLMQAASWWQQQQQEGGTARKQPQLLQHVRSRWLEVSALQCASVSSFQQQVYAELDGMGLEPQVRLGRVDEGAGGCLS